MSDLESQFVRRALALPAIIVARRRLRWRRVWMWLLLTLALIALPFILTELAITLSFWPNLIVATSKFFAGFATVSYFISALADLPAYYHELKLAREEAERYQDVLLDQGELDAMVKASFDDVDNRAEWIKETLRENWKMLAKYLLLAALMVGAFVGVPTLAFEVAMISDEAAGYASFVFIFGLLFFFPAMAMVFKSLKSAGEVQSERLKAKQLEEEREIINKTRMELGGDQFAGALSMSGGEDEEGMRGALSPSAESGGLSQVE